MIGLIEKYAKLENQIKNDPEFDKMMKQKREELYMTPDKLLEKNQDYPSASSALTQNYSPTKGRFVTAKSFIKKGEFLYVEKPFAFVPLFLDTSENTSQNICAHCCGPEADVPFPLVK